MEFDFDFEVDGDDDITNKPSRGAYRGLLAFHVVSTNPSRAKVVNTSRRAPEKSLVIAPVDVLASCSANDRYHLLVALENESGNGESNQFFLSSAMIPFAQRKAMVRWETTGELAYTFRDVDLPPGLANDMHTLLMNLVKAQQADPKLPCVKVEPTQSPAQYEVLQHLLRRGLVEKVRQDLDPDLWSLTVRGVSRMVIANRWRIARSLTDPRPGVKTSDLSTLELHSILFRDGWICRVKESRKPGLDKDGKRIKRVSKLSKDVPVDYIGRCLPLVSDLQNHVVCV